jgi:ribosomal protein L29
MEDSELSDTTIETLFNNLALFKRKLINLMFLNLVMKALQVNQLEIS